MVALVEGDNAKFFSIVDQVLKFRRSRDLQTLKYAKTVQAQPTAGSPRNIAVYAMFQLQARKRTQFAIHVIQQEHGFGLWGVRANRTDVISEGSHGIPVPDLSRALVAIVAGRAAFGGGGGVVGQVGVVGVDADLGSEGVAQDADVFDLQLHGVTGFQPA